MLLLCCQISYAIGYTLHICLLFSFEFRFFKSFPRFTSDRKTQHLFVETCTATVNPDFTVFEDWQIHGKGHILDTMAPSLDECKCLCGNDPKCTTFMYIANNHYKCTLYSGLVQYHYSQNLKKPAGWGHSGLKHGIIFKSSNMHSFECFRGL